MKTITLLLLSLKMVICVYDTARKHTSGTGIASVKLVASADGTSYFADNTLRNRTEASRFCKALGMSLASISTTNQWNSLDAAYTNLEFPGTWGHWTSAQDSLLLSQFRWEGQEQPLEGSFIKFRYKIAATRLTCLAFLSAPGIGTSQMIFLPCSEERPVLCQVTNSRIAQDKLIL